MKRNSIPLTNTMTSIRKAKGGQTCRLQSGGAKFGKVFIRLIVERKAGRLLPDNVEKDLAGGPFLMKGFPFCILTMQGNRVFVSESFILYV